MFFMNRKDKSEQRGTLMVEAIAMLGLIAIVTPTLYKKSAERLQEIQDINVASQARTMSQIVETFVRNHAALFRHLDSTSPASVYEICEKDNCADQSEHLDTFLNDGYSSAIPFGFMPDELKNFEKPRVFVVSESGNVVFYVVYPSAGSNGNIGKKRTARLASLIGANGGFVDKASSQVLGTGGAWELDSTMINEFNLPKEFLKENSIVVTNNEPITVKMDETDKYLHRIAPAELSGMYVNTMITDLYLGGHEQESSETSVNDASKEYYSIFNVRKMTLNTNCSGAYINNASNSSSAMECDPDVADLYIGKPTSTFRKNPLQNPGVQGRGQRPYHANTGAAWIYGNFAALSDRFKVFHTAYDSAEEGSYDRRGFDVMRFSRLDSSVDVWDGNDSSGLDLAILTASNQDNSAYVSMMNGLVRVVEDNGRFAGASTPAFLVGGSTGTNDVKGDNGGRLIAAYNGGAGGVVNINSLSNQDETRINEKGGYVYINGDDSSVTGELNANTYINQHGGNLMAGKDGDWINAGGIDGSAHVDIFLPDDENKSRPIGDRRFSVGVVGNVRSEKVDAEYMIYADSSVTSLRDGAIRAYKFNGVVGGNVGGRGMFGGGVYEGNAPNETNWNNGAMIAARYTDILGPTYIGNKVAMSSTIDDSDFERNSWALGVAGSAWVDDLLFANDAWFNSSGVKELHAGFSSFNEYKNTPRKGWLNADKDGVAINNREAADGSTGVHAEYTRFYADKNLVYMGDSLGAMAHLEDGIAKLGYTDVSSGLPDPINYVGADSTRAFVEGQKLVEIYTSSGVINSSDAVDIQKGAMLFKGHSWTTGGRTTHDYTENEIEMHAKQFTLQTSSKTEDGPEAAMLLADKEQLRTRFVEFKVQNDSSKNIFHVRPNMDASSTTDSANVTVNGSFYVTGNDVFHAATYNSDTKPDADERHATFEIDPQFVRVMAREGADPNSFVGLDGNKLAMFEVNAYDVKGESSYVAKATGEADPTRRASVYVRRGAIELEKSVSAGDSSYAADEGRGYIKANRFVSNADVAVPSTLGKTNDGTLYDQYMVNPAYTSVMHDIKLTTRGGARLSDILPDYVLKGVYNISNDYIEGSDKKKENQLCWSSGRRSNCKSINVAWADPYVGKLPYAICPPGYKNLATLVPTSFQMAQAGDMVKAKTASNIKGGRSDAYVINPAGSRQANILAAAKTSGEISYPNLVKSVSFEVKKGYDGEGAFSSKDWYSTRTEGWFMGYEAYYASDTNPLAGTVSNNEIVGADESNPESRSAYKYTPGVSNRTAGFVPEPLYFQQNTYLKTALSPLDFNQGGWEARMGFIYDQNNYSGYDDIAGLGGAGILSQNNDGTGNEDGSSSHVPYSIPGSWVWNLFPVPTNTLEGHATVYCYFDRAAFAGWSSLVDQVDQLNHYRNPREEEEAKDPDYIKRLNDPSLKYTDPW